MTYHITKVEQKTVKFSSDISVEGFRLPNGEFRISITSASVALGYQKNWLGRAIARTGNTFKSLQGFGFEGNFHKVVTPSNGGKQETILITLDDFNTLILYCASKGKKEAIALNKALVKISLNDMFLLTYEDRQLSLEEKRELFYQEYAKTIDWFKEDYLDFMAIEEHQMFLQGKS